MPSNLRWHGDEARDQVRTLFTRRLTAAAVTLTNTAKGLINREGAEEVKGAAKRDAKGRFLKQKRLRYGARRSAPGEPPMKQTGRLLGSVAFEVHDLVARVGTNVKYARALELGTRRMAARPWLRPALAKCQQQIRSILRG